MRFQKWMMRTAALAIACAMAVPLLSRADDAKTGGAKAAATGEPVPAKKAVAKKVTQEDVTRGQQAVELRFRKFEDAMHELVQVLAKTEPRKAELLRQAIGRSQEQRIGTRMNQVIALLKTKGFSEAVVGQDDLIVKLQSLLELLQSEDRIDELRAEQKRIQDLLKDLKKLINKEKFIRFQTERGQLDASALAKIQKEIAEKTKELKEKIDRQDAAKNAKANGGKPKDNKSKSEKSKKGDPKQGNPKQGNPKQGDPKQGMPKNGDPKSGMPKSGKPKSGMPKSGMPKSGMPKSGMPKSGMPKSGMPKSGMPKSGMPKSGMPKSGMPKSGMPKSGMPKSGMPKSGDPKSGQPKQQPPQKQNPEDQQKTPGRDDIAKAEEAMRRAIERLQKAEKEGAADEQSKALDALKDAEQKLEEILRQLREEERKLLLRALAARFKNMLKMQKVILNGTIALNTTPHDKWKSSQIARSRSLAGEEGKLVIEADKALVLLKAEGSSIAFPEACEQIREDMLTVTRMLSKEDAGKDNQAIQRDIIDALEEMVEALKKEIDEGKPKPPPPGKPKDGKPADPSLVDKLAELKMLRSLQMRVNRRTRRLGNKFKGEQATEKEAGAVQQLKQLAKRQARIQKAAYDLATNKNQ